MHMYRLVLVVFIEDQQDMTDLPMDQNFVEGIRDRAVFMFCRQP